jgi:tryptophan synthase alpha chain
MEMNHEQGMNRIDQAFNIKGRGLLNIYYTAGFPEKGDTIRIARTLESAGVEMIEIGIPYSDPIADGETIQFSSKRALEQGMSIAVLFDQLESLRNTVTIPVILMGYFNPVLQFGIEQFCKKCKEVGVDGLIIPDLPMNEYLDLYKDLFDQYGLYNIFLITPQTSDDRIRMIDQHSNGFVYMVSSSSITGAQETVSIAQQDYFHRIQQMNLKTKRMIGFGISNKQAFDNACEYADGAIIGSAFINQLNKDASTAGIDAFVKCIKT